MTLYELSKVVYRFLRDQGIDRTVSTNINLFVNLVLVSLLLLFIDWFIRKFIVVAFHMFSNRTKTTFDDFLVKSNFPKYIGHIIPFIIFVYLIPTLFDDFPKWEKILLKATDIYIIVLSVWIVRSIVKSTREYLKSKDDYKDKPIDSFAQVIILFLWFIGFIFIYSEFTEEKMLQFLGTLGAASAIILLMFRDTILGFVASIQVSINDMVRIGDWITQEKYGADGNVTEINLTTVKVQNFDYTITTIPTYALISDSFKNWRGMQDSGGRRIRRAIYIKANSIKFLSKDDLERFSKIQMITHYIEHRQKDIDKYNTDHGYNKDVMINGRNQTNFGIFRKYCDLYLKNHPATNKDMLMMTRHLPPTPQGIPLEIYVFSSDKRWENYERIMADIFEHLIAAAPYFDLELYELPTGKDFTVSKHLD